MSTPTSALSTIDQRSPPSPQTISVVVPCHNAAATIGSLLEALAGQTRPPDEVIVVDDGSTDETVGVVARAQSLLARLKITTLKHRRRSIPATLNAGIAAATGGIIVRLDAHSVPDADYIERAIAALRSTGAGVVGGRWRIRPGTSGAMAQAIALAVSHPLGAGDAAYRLCHEDGTPRRVETVPFGVFRRDVWIELGGFDESLLANEDYEFNHRVRLSGRDVVLDPAIVSAYSSRPTLRELSRQYFRYGWWKARMLRRHPGSLRWRQAVPPAFVVVFTLSMISAAIGPAGRLVPAALPIGYGLVVLGVCAWFLVRRGSTRLLLHMAAAVATVHFSWGTGFLLSLLTLGAWRRSGGSAVSHARSGSTDHASLETGLADTERRVD